MMNQGPTFLCIFTFIHIKVDYILPCSTLLSLISKWIIYFHAQLFGLHIFQHRLVFCSHRCGTQLSTNHCECRDWLDILCRLVHLLLSPGLHQLEKKKVTNFWVSTYYYNVPSSLKQFCVMKLTSLKHQSIVYKLSS